MTVTTSTERLGVSILRIRLGGALQRHRLQRGLTQAQLAEFADLSLKYVGEIERGEANTTLEVLERLAAAVGWSPMDALEGLREPLSEACACCCSTRCSRCSIACAA
jgi:DNA-binding XRE family transcriptional regulator